MNTKTIRSGIYYEIDITTDRTGRTSIVVRGESLDYRNNRKTLVDVELPSKTGEYKDAFPPTVHVREGIDVESNNVFFVPKGYISKSKIKEDDIKVIVSPEVD